MNSPGQITLHELVIHKIEHIYSSEPILSDLKSPISEEVDIYLRDHIFYSLEHEFARNGVFTNGADGKTSMKSLCDELLAPPGRFVQQSRKIAAHLFDVMKGDGRISSGDLVVCTFSEKEDGPRWLALMKMDPQDSFVAEDDWVADKRRLVLKRVRDVMPMGELQKCAFVLPESLRDRRRDLIVLDQQTARYGARQLVASFFSKDFLQCQVGLNQREMTQTFMAATRDWIDSKKGVWSAKAVKEFKDSLSAMMKMRTIRVTTFARAAIVEQDEQSDYLEKLLQHLRAARLQDMVFKPDLGVLARPPMVQFDGDDDLRIRIREDAVGPGKTLSYTHNQATNTYTITIRTTNLSKVNK